MSHGKGSYKLLYDADREYPLEPGLIISRDEMEYMRDMETIAEGSIFKATDLTALLIVRRRNGKLVLEPIDRRKQRDYPLPAMSG